MKTKISVQTMRVTFLFILFIFLQLKSFSQDEPLIEYYVQQDETSGLFGIIDPDGAYFVEPVYKEIFFQFGPITGMIKVMNADDKIGFIDKSGKEIIPCRYDDVSGFESGFTIVKIKTGEYDYKHGLLDSTGKEVVPMNYERLEYYAEDKVLVFGEENTSKVGLMDLTGKVLIPAQYEFWSKRVSKGMWPVGTWPEGTNGICGVVNLQNETIVPFTFEMIESYSDELNIASAKKDGKYGFIDRTGKTVIPFIYSNGWTSGTLLAVKKDGKWGVINTDSKIILPFEFSSITSIMSKTAWVSKNETDGDFEIDLVTKQKVKE